jgi:hypothetical protein
MARFSLRGIIRVPASAPRCGWGGPRGDWPRCERLGRRWLDSSSRAVGGVAASSRGECWRPLLTLVRHRVPVGVVTGSPSPSFERDLAPGGSLRHVCAPRRLGAAAGRTFLALDTRNWSQSTCPASPRHPRGAGAERLGMAGFGASVAPHAQRPPALHAGGRRGCTRARRHPSEHGVTDGCRPHKETVATVPRKGLMEHPQMTGSR